MRDVIEMEPVSLLERRVRFAIDNESDEADSRSEMDVQLREELESCMQQLNKLGLLTRAFTS